MFRNEGFANFGYFYRVLPKSHFFYTVEVCGNGYWRNGVTTSLFMTLVLHIYNKEKKCRWENRDKMMMPEK